MGGIMKVMAIAAASLLVMGCNPSAAPVGGGNQVSNSQPATGASAAATPTLDRAFLIGRWTDNGDCSNATEFSENNQFRTSSGLGGLWTLEGDQLTLTGSQRLTMQIVIVDQSTINVVNPNGSTGRSTRC